MGKYHKGASRNSGLKQFKAYANKPTITKVKKAAIVRAKAQAALRSPRTPKSKPAKTEENLLRNYKEYSQRQLPKESDIVWGNYQEALNSLPVRVSIGIQQWIDTLSETYGEDAVYQQLKESGAFDDIQSYTDESYRVKRAMQGLLTTAVTLERMYNKDADLAWDIDSFARNMMNEYADFNSLKTQYSATFTELMGDIADSFDDGFDDKIWFE